MGTFTLEQLKEKGIAEIPSDAAVITNDGQLYIHVGKDSWVETGVIAMEIANKNV